MRPQQVLHSITPSRHHCITASSEPAMFTRIDHVMICVPDLKQGLDQYGKMGFNIYPGGVHTGKGTHNAIAFNRDDYIELLAVRDEAEHEVEARRPGSTHADLTKFIAAGGGLRY